MVGGGVGRRHRLGEGEIPGLTDRRRLYFSQMYDLKFEIVVYKV